MHRRRAGARRRAATCILTVPLANRQREIEREIDELDRGVHLASLFFVLLGAGIGLSMAERIADPVRRLTRATRRIARGDFDARIAVKSADELRRLVDAFNSMAAELKAPARAARTDAPPRGVGRDGAAGRARDQESADADSAVRRAPAPRARRPRRAAGRRARRAASPRSSAQVRLLRQISAEFSSFASSPTARRAPVDVPELVADVVDPYRTGLAGRIEIDNRVAGAAAARASSTAR